MTIRVNCPDCGQEYRLSDSLAGKKAKCKACGGVVEIPASAEDHLVDMDEPAPPKPAARKPPTPPVPARPATSAAAPPKPPPIPKAAAAAPALPKISVSCDMCFTDFQAKGELAGKKAKCPECGEMVSVPGGKPKAKAKPKPVEDDDDFADDVAFVDDDEFEDDEPAPRRSSSKGKDKKKKSKGGRRSNSEYFIDNIPMPVLIGGMWTMIIVACVMLVVFGKTNRNGAAMAGANGLFDPPSVPAATSGPATEPYNIAAIPVPPLPEPGPLMPSPTGGFVYSEAQFTDASQPGGMMKVRLRLPNGQHAAQSLGCILVGSAGTPMIWGNGLAGTDYYAETQPYITAGYAVCEYSMDGEFDEENEDETDTQLKIAYQKFTASCAGVVNVRNAVEFVVAKMPQINPNRIYIAGHSSAGATALLAAAHEPRIKACMAYAAPADILQRQAEMLDEMDFSGFKPDIREFLQRSSPMTHVAKIQCPVFLFHASDDSVVTLSESQQMNKRLMDLGRSVTLQIVPTGDHYVAMTQQGLQTAVAWLKQQPSEQPGGGAPAGGQNLPAETQPTVPMPGTGPIPGITPMPMPGVAMP